MSNRRCLPRANTNAGTKWLIPSVPVRPEHGIQIPKREATAKPEYQMIRIQHPKIDTVCQDDGRRGGREQADRLKARRPVLADRSCLHAGLKRAEGYADQDANYNIFSGSAGRPYASSSLAARLPVTEELTVRYLATIGRHILLRH